MSTATNNNNQNNTSGQTLEELDRQIKQAEMIRQYLQVTNIDRNSLSNRQRTTSEPEPSSTPAVPSLSSFNFNELRKDLKMAEERVERLRREVKELQTKRDEPLIKTPPPPPPPPPAMSSNYLLSNPISDYQSYHLPTSPNRSLLDRSTPPLIQELLSSQPPRQMTNNGITSSFLSHNFNPISPSSTISADIPKDHRLRQFYLTMREHREQLVIYLDSLKQALNSLDRLASLEPTPNEVHLANMKIDTIQQKTRQLRALKSSRSSQQSPFIECRIRQLEHDLVYMLSEHQKDVQAKLELNEQRSLMLLKIMQVTDELASIDQQIQQLLSNTNSTTHIHRRTLSSLSDEINQQQTSSSTRVMNPMHNLNGRRVSFREPTDHNPLSKTSNSYYYQY